MGRMASAYSGSSCGGHCVQACCGAEQAAAPSCSQQALVAAGCQDALHGFSMWQHDVTLPAHHSVGACSNQDWSLFACVQLTPGRLGDTVGTVRLPLHNLTWARRVLSARCATGTATDWGVWSAMEGPLLAFRCHQDTALATAGCKESRQSM